MFQSIWQSPGESGPTEDVGIFPRRLQEELSLQQKFFPVEIRLNFLTSLFSISIPGLFWGSLGINGWISCKSLQKLYIEHSPFSRQVDSSHLLITFRVPHLDEERPSSWPKVTLQSQHSAGEVQRHTKSSENRRAVLDTSGKKQSLEQCSFPCSHQNE